MTDFLSASPVIQLHIIVALIAFVIGPIALVRRRRDGIHKTLGYVFVVTMAATALSSFFIHTIRLVGVFSPIHLLSILALVSLFTSIRAIRNKDVTEHRRIMFNLYTQAMGIAGLFTFLPGRLMNDIVPYFDPWTIFLMACGVFGAIVWALFRNLRSEIRV